MAAKFKLFIGRLSQSLTFLVNLLLFYRFDLMTLSQNQGSVHAFSTVPDQGSVHGFSTAPEIISLDSGRQKDAVSNLQPSSEYTFSNLQPSSDYTLANLPPPSDPNLPKRIAIQINAPVDSTELQNFLAADSDNLIPNNSFTIELDRAIDDAFSKVNSEITGHNSEITGDKVSETTTTGQPDKVNSETAHKQKYAPSVIKKENTKQPVTIIIDVPANADAKSFKDKIRQKPAIVAWMRKEIENRIENFNHNVNNVTNEQKNLLAQKKQTLEKTTERQKIEQLEPRVTAGVIKLIVFGLTVVGTSVGACLYDTEQCTNFFFEIPKDLRALATKTGCYVKMLSCGGYNQKSGWTFEQGNPWTFNPGTWGRDDYSPQWFDFLANILNLEPNELENILNLEPLPNTLQENQQENQQSSNIQQLSDVQKINQAQEDLKLQIGFGRHQSEGDCLVTRREAIADYCRWIAQSRKMTEIPLTGARKMSELTGARKMTESGPTRARKMTEVIGARKMTESTVPVNLITESVPVTEGPAVIQPIGIPENPTTIESPAVIQTTTKSPVIGGPAIQTIPESASVSELPANDAKDPELEIVPTGAKDPELEIVPTGAKDSELEIVPTGAKDSELVSTTSATDHDATSIAVTSNDAENTVSSANSNIDTVSANTVSANTVRKTTTVSAERELEELEPTISEELDSELEPKFIMFYAQCEKEQTCKEVRKYPLRFWNKEKETLCTWTTKCEGRDVMDGHLWRYNVKEPKMKK